MRDGWALINVGVLSKHYGPVDGTHAFWSTFSPLLFGVVNKEGQATYKHVFEAAKQCAKVCMGLDLEPCVSQYHCDWHPAEHAALRDSFPHALRVADFVHFIGACLRQKRQQVDDETIQVYRAGFPQTIRKHAVDKSWAPYLVSWVHVLRAFPSALLFHGIVERLLESLVAAGEGSCATAFRQHYLTRASAVAFNVRGNDDLTVADWWAGLRRLQPGSASGTQAQESWHRHALKKYIVDLRQDVGSFVASLSSFTSSRLQQLKLQSPLLPDVPVEPFPDKFVLEDSAALTKVGRSSACQYHRTSRL